MIDISGLNPLSSSHPTWWNIWHGVGGVSILVSTPPKFNMEPQNDGFQKESPFPGADFKVPC